MEGEAPAQSDPRRGEWTERDGPPASVEELATATTIVAELLCERIDLHPGQIVLDVATGSGNGALAAARRGCVARGVDPLPAWLERARERARAERLRARFQLGGADAIPFPDAAFDVVLSVFGVMFAPDPRQVMAELLRVCRPGGTVALASWTPKGFFGAMFGAAGQQTPPSREPSGPTTWGTEPGIRSLFGGHVRGLQVSHRNFVLRCRSPEHFLELIRTPWSSTASAFHMPAAKEDDLARHLTLVGRFNQAEDGSMVVPSDYLEVVAVKR